jgi:serine/threonine-protein kinase PknK
VSERASLSLVEVARRHAFAGELGAAFRTLCDEKQHAKGKQHVAARACLQAYCGNRDAALALVSDLDRSSETLLVRSAVAASWGDWHAALEDALRCTDVAALVSTAATLAARAHLELGQEEDARRMLERLAAAPDLTILPVESVRARAQTNPVVSLERLAEQSRSHGALLLEAEAWTDLAAVHRTTADEEAARAAALRACELWDDVAMTLPVPLRAGFWRDARRRSVREASERTGVSSLQRGKPETGLPLLLDNLRGLASERDPSRLLERITDGAVSLSGAERGFVLLVDESGRLEPRTIRVAEAELGSRTAAFSRSIAEAVLIDREPVITIDAAHDARVQDYMSVHQLMLKSVACLPIETRGRTWGVLYLEHRTARGRFSGADLSLLCAFADQAAIAIETTDLIERVESQKRAVERANQALSEANARLEERLDGQAEALERTRREIARLRAPTERGERWGLVGASEAMQRVYDVVERIAGNDVPVVITGESGTGKELVARAIHRASGRRNCPFVSLSCGAIPEGLLESELFGHVAGAFTGATRAREGLLAEAEGGTLFLDEIEDMPARMQLDLLRVLQERRIRPVGASGEKAIDVRVITACRRPLQELIDEGRLREDLYYRLAVVEVGLPPLRDRRADIPLLCEHFLARLGQNRSQPPKRLSRAALRRLALHDFPGNVRELEHLLMNASVFASGDTIEADELALEETSTTRPPRADTRNYRDFKEAERDRILEALNAHGWNRARAARALGMARRTFYRRLKEHGIQLPGGKS